LVRKRRRAAKKAKRRFPQAKAPQRHVIEPATASEIREALGLGQRDLDEARKLLGTLGLNG
jgi:hypothetical protein